MKILLIVLTLCLSFSVKATPMEAAANCTDNCPYPSELYKSDKAFADALAGNLRAIGIKDAFTRTGALNGTESPVSSYKYKGDTVIPAQFALVTVLPTSISSTTSLPKQPQLYISKVIKLL